jgi:U3 small nucleolar RNA-associated protein 3
MDYPEEDEDADEPKSASKSSKKAKKKVNKPDDSSESENSDDESEEETWGTKKSAFYDADEVDSDDEEALELEEQEARRLQAKARSDMTEDDFGLNDAAFTEDLQDEEYVPPLLW